MSPGSSTESYPALAHIGLRENPGKNLNQVTCPDRESNPGHLVSRLDVLTVTPQATKENFEGGEFDQVLWIEFGVAQWSERLVRRTKDSGLEGRGLLVLQPNVLFITPVDIFSGVVHCPLRYERDVNTRPTTLTLLAENPYRVIGHERDSPKVNVWLGMHKNEVIDPFFFMEPTVTGVTYLDMLENFAIPQFPPGLTFQQDGTPPHFHRNVFGCDLPKKLDWKEWANFLAD
ncbi:hypothetical protein ANN_16765 [Periplaneta americana]|uniref:Uncharacterized protein n=1 Tax=Periplaneta americana TaxID=6978 RepID=A0ABQ8SR08_PERAM|nr:hypothetical protein ANN_16765 [Periplaneta americana]